MSQTALDEEVVYMFHSQRQTCTRDRNIVTSRAPLCTLRGKKVLFCFFFMPGSKIKVKVRWEKGYKCLWISIHLDASCINAANGIFLSE